jgi:acetolactate synthase-1/2/3 large subunit
MRQISGNKLLVKALREEGVDTIFGYPGACTIDISDELYKQNEIEMILPRHEQALVHAADAYAQNNRKGWRMSRYQRTGRDQPGDRSCNSKL